MTNYSGSAFYLAWVWSGGTIPMHGDFREFSYEPTLSLIDSTAGSDRFREVIGGVGEGGDIKYSSVMQKAGTALITALARGNYGTLLMGVEGTVVDKPKITIPAISKGPAVNIPYSDIVEFSVGFQQNAAETVDIWEAQPVTLLFDTFTDTENVLLGSHTPDIGDGWTTVAAGYAKIKSNKLGTTWDALSVHVCDVGFYNVIVEWDAVIATAGYMGAIFRYVDIDNYYKISVHENGNIYIVDRTAGVESNLGTDIVGYAHGANLHLKLTLTGTTIKLDWSGDATGSRVTTQAARLTATKHGIWTWEFSPCDGRMDNFVITTNPLAARELDVHAVASTIYVIPG